MLPAGRRSDDGCPPSLGRADGAARSPARARPRAPLIHSDDADRGVPAVLAGAFALFGLFIGVQGVLWPEIVAALGLRAGVFGLAQLAPALVAIAVMLAGGPLCARVGKKSVALASLAGLTGAALLLGRADGLAVFVVALLLQGAGFGGLEAAVNGAILDWERASRRSGMSLMHAGFSAGAVGGALGAGALLGRGVGYPMVLATLGIAAALVFAISLPVRYPAEQTRPAGSVGPTAALGAFRRSRSLWYLAAIVVLGVMGESVANTWAVLYLRELGAGALVGGSAFALFNAAVAVGRLLNAPLVARVGPQISLLASGLALILAATLLVLSGGLALAVAGFVVLGLAVAGVVPTVLGAAARVVPGRSGALAGGIMAVGYVGFLLAPPLVGGLAELSSLRIALLTVGLAGLGILWLARDVRGADPRRGPSSAHDMS